MLQQGNGNLEQRRQDALLKEYSEVSNNFRMLTDIRFKLLAFLPIAAAAAAALKPEDTGPMELAFSLFGLVVTIGLVTYNARNDQLYDDLVDRAAAIERSLNIPDGAFANRPIAWRRIKLPPGKWKIDHRTAVSTIYSASIALWLFGVMSYVLGAFAKDSKFWVQWTAIAIAIIVTYLGSWLIKVQKESQQKEMRYCAREAVYIGASFLSAPQAAGNERFIELCAELSNKEVSEVRARARFYANTAPTWLRYYLYQEGDDWSACHLVALLTDLSPLWIFDCCTNRKGFIPEEWH
jgi:hypothetical protein